jgi:hypothetical protein
MIDFVADENFDNRIVRGLLRRKPELDIVRVQDLVIAGGDDNIVLAWAAQSNRVLLTHDQRTIPKYVFERLQKSEAVSGVIVVKDTLPLGSVIDDILLIAEATTMADWVDQIQRLPL